VPWIPADGALICFAQMAALPFDTWTQLIIWMGLGLIIYSSYSRHHSKFSKID